jgi:hypothetical protein
MKQHLWSNPEEEWGGFQPVSYWLDRKVLQRPLTMKPEDGSAETPTTVGDVWKKLADKQLTDESLSGFCGMDTEVETTDGLKLLLKGPTFNIRILELMLTFRAEGVDPFDVALFYYDNDSCLKEPNNCFSFFAVQKNKIIREQLNFFDHNGSGFDPSVFAQPDNSDRTWSDERDWDEARARFWYRKFYSETHAGQLMALRPTAPTLFFHEDRTAADNMGALGVIARSLNSVRLLLWALVILTIFGFIFHWK